MAARGLALSVAAVAALSVSGVAAAVTGDPLAPYEKVIERVVDVVRPQTTLPLDRLDGMVIGSKAEMVRAEQELAERQYRDQATLDVQTDDATVAKSPLDLLSTVVEQRAMARPPIVTTPTSPAEADADRGGGDARSRATRDDDADDDDGDGDGDDVAVEPGADAGAGDPGAAGDADLGADAAGRADRRPTEQTTTTLVRRTPVAPTRRSPSWVTRAATRPTARRHRRRPGR